MPVIVPEIGEFGQFDMSVGQTHVDSAGQVLPLLIWNGLASRSAIVPQDCAAGHGIPLEGNWRLTSVKIRGGNVSLQRDWIKIVLIEKQWCLRWFLKRSEFWKEIPRIAISPAYPPKAGG
jgi:hypothetical protein